MNAATPHDALENQSEPKFQKKNNSNKEKGVNQFMVFFCCRLSLQTRLWKKNNFGNTLIPFSVSQGGLHSFSFFFHPHKKKQRLFFLFFLFLMIFYFYGETGALFCQRDATIRYQCLILFFSSFF